MTYRDCDWLEDPVLDQSQQPIFSMDFNMSM